MDQNQEPTEEPSSGRQQAIRKHWFQGLTGTEQDGIIRPHFEQANPSNEAIRKVAEDYDKRK